MGWRADGGLWLLVRGGGLFLSKGTRVRLGDLDKQELAPFLFISSSLLLQNEEAKLPLTFVMCCLG